MDKVEQIFVEKLKELQIDDVEVRLGYETVDAGKLPNTIAVINTGFTPLEARELRERDNTVDVRVIGKTPPETREIGEAVLLLLHDLEGHPELQQVTLTSASFAPTTDNLFFVYVLTYSVYCAH